MHYYTQYHICIVLLAYFWAFVCVSMCNTDGGFPATVWRPIFCSMCQMYFLASVGLPSSLAPLAASSVFTLLFPASGPLKVIEDIRIALQNCHIIRFHVMSAETVWKSWLRGHTDMQAEGHIDRLTDWLTDRQIVRQTEGKTYRLQRDRQDRWREGRDTDRETEIGPTDKQHTDIHTYIHTYRHTDIRTDR